MLTVHLHRAQMLHRAGGQAWQGSTVGNSIGGTAPGHGDRLFRAPCRRRRADPVGAGIQPDARRHGLSPLDRALCRCLRDGAGAARSADPAHRPPPRPAQAHGRYRPGARYRGHPPGDLCHPQAGKSGAGLNPAHGQGKADRRHRGGIAFCATYRTIRESVLAEPVAADGPDAAALAQAASVLRRLSERYNQAARAAATL
jgi:hypothetical protein